MRAGGGKAKGSEFERKTCKALSLWLSHGQQTDLFTRNVLSGGRFTIMQDKGDAGMPGDVAASHPLSHAFLERVLIECKHYKDLKLGELLHKPWGKTQIGLIYEKAHAQAKATKRSALLIAQQNHVPPLLIANATVGDALCDAFSARRGIQLNFHTFYSNRIFVFNFEDVTNLVSAEAFLGALP